MDTVTTSDPGPISVDGAVAVVTGGASGIGRVVVEALLDQGATVYVADVEQVALEAAVAELADHGPVVGAVLDVTDEAATAALADRVFSEHGRCNFLFLNAGVTSGGGGLPWQQEPNDWRWCLGVNVVGIGIGVSAFVPRMIESGVPGQVVLTGSKDGGIAPVPTASVSIEPRSRSWCVRSFPTSMHRPGSTVVCSILQMDGP